jgi:hypothetical protein
MICRWWCSLSIHEGSLYEGVKSSNRLKEFRGDAEFQFGIMPREKALYSDVVSVVSEFENCLMLRLWSMVCKKSQNGTKAEQRPYPSGTLSTWHASVKKGVRGWLSLIWKLSLKLVLKLSHGHFSSLSFLQRNENRCHRHFWIRRHKSTANHSSSP